MNIAKLRKQFQSAAKHEPPSTQPFIEQIDTQLRNYAKANAEDRHRAPPANQRQH